MGAPQAALSFTGHVGVADRVAALLSLPAVTKPGWGARAVQCHTVVLSGDQLCSNTCLMTNKCRLTEGQGHRPQRSEEVFAPSRLHWSSVESLSMVQAQTRVEHVEFALKTTAWGIVKDSRVGREQGITLGRLPVRGGNVDVLRAPKLGAPAMRWSSETLNSTPSFGPTALASVTMRAPSLCACGKPQNRSRKLGCAGRHAPLSSDKLLRRPQLPSRLLLAVDRARARHHHFRSLGLQ